MPVSAKVFAALVAGIFLAGCSGHSGPGRIAVAGKIVTATGGPVNGSISFLPEPGTEGPAATASIVQGRYGFDKTTGPVAGRYQVMIKPRSDAPRPRPTPAGNAESLTFKGSHFPPEQLFNVQVSTQQHQFDFRLK